MQQCHTSLRDGYGLKFPNPRSFRDDVLEEFGVVRHLLNSFDQGQVDVNLLQDVEELLELIFLLLPLQSLGEWWWKPDVLNPFFAWNFDLGYRFGFFRYLLCYGFVSGWCS